MTRARRRADWLRRWCEAPMDLGRPETPALQGRGPREGWPGAARPSVALHVEELVLRGFGPAEGRRVGDALQRECVRLLGERGLPPVLSRPRDIVRLDGGPTTAPASSASHAVGVQAARAIWGATTG
jgi:hypothetical protein